MKTRYILALLLAVIPVIGQAVTPETGMYYDPVRQGLGYYVEVQGDTLVLIAFAYEQETGKPTFYYSAGKITHSHPRDSTAFTPPGELQNEDAYEYSGDIYKSDTGPCLTCSVLNWNTAEHAVKAGTVHMRFADKNNTYFAFSMNDGTNIGTYMRRQGFGRPGYIIRDDGSLLDSTPTLFPSMQGEWVFTDQDSDAGSALNGHYNFTEVEGPKVFDNNVFGKDLKNPKIVRFIDPEANVMLSCLFQGCALLENGVIKAYIKFHDVGMDHVVGYVGEKMYPDREDIYYRSTHLITGVRIANPVPDIARTDTQEGR